MKLRGNSKKLRDDQSGLVSIVVAVLIMILLSLIVTAMSRNATREQRQALDRQLNSGAFYAAEAGINDVVYYVHVNDDEAAEKTDCDPTGLQPDVPTNKLDNPTTGGIEYSCVLYDQNPPRLEYSSIDPDKSTLIPIESQTGVNSLKFSWQAADLSQTDISGCSTNPSSTFVPNNNWPATCTPGILRVELVSLTNLSRDGLISNTRVMYIVPRNTSAGGSLPLLVIPKGTETGGVYEAACTNSSTPKKCNFTISNIFLGADQKMYLRVRSVYNANTLAIEGSDLTGGPVRFRNAQIVIDATGKATDVLKRLQVRVPVETPFPATDFAIHSTNTICKLLQVYPPDHASSADPATCRID